MCLNGLRDWREAIQGKYNRRRVARTILGYSERPSHRVYQTIGKLLLSRIDMPVPSNREARDEVTNINRVILIPVIRIWE
jgi:hypothetical protein